MTKYEYKYHLAFQKWPNTNTNIIWLSKKDWIPIRILFGKLVFRRIPSGIRFEYITGIQMKIIFDLKNYPNLNTNNNWNHPNTNNIWFQQVTRIWIYTPIFSGIAWLGGGRGVKQGDPFFSPNIGFFSKTKCRGFKFFLRVQK